MNKYNSLKEKIPNKLSRLELLILNLLNADNSEPIRDDLFLQKEMFLVINFINEMKPDADFIPHRLGPYSEPVEVSLNNLKSINLIEKTSKGYKITDFGKDIFETIKDRIPEEKKIAIEDFKDFLNDLTKDELLVFVYFSFPDMRTESNIFQEIKRKRVPASISLYEKGKISLEKAAQLSGLPIEEFVERVKEKHENS